jgi:hydrogenase maturation protease
VIDVGTPGLDLAPFVLGADALIVVDSIRAEAPAGTVRQYRREALLTHAPPQRLGPHDPGFTQTLLTLEFAGCAPRDVLLVGAVAQTTAPRNRLSARLLGAVPAAVAAVLAELERLGAPASARAARATVEPWWERGLFLAAGNIPPP